METLKLIQKVVDINDKGEEVTVWDTVALAYPTRSGHGYRLYMLGEGGSSARSDLFLFPAKPRAEVKKKNHVKPKEIEKKKKKNMVDLSGYPVNKDLPF